MKRKIIIVMMILMGLVLIPFATDFIYGQIAQHRLSRWEAGVQRDAKGVRIGFTEFEVGEGDTALLMIHGFSSAPAVFQKMAPALAERGYHCRAVRLPGFGEPMRAMKQVRASDWESAVAAETERLRGRYTNVWLVGHSLGGALALRQALTKPDSIDGLVLLAPLLDVSSARSPLVRPRALFRFGRFFLKSDDVFESVFPVDVHDKSLRLDDQRDLFIPVAIYDAMFDVVDAVAPHAEDIRLPMLMALSKDDKVSDYRAAERYYIDAPARPKDILVMEDAGHVIPLDHGWTSVVARMDDFMRQAHDAEQR